MSDLYLEEMVKRRWTAKDKAIRMILMVLTVLLIIGAFFCSLYSCVPGDCHLRGGYLYISPV